jgi:hypothetical protein
MTVRYYIVPADVTTVITSSGSFPARGPKYFGWKFDPDPPGIVCPYGTIDYGNVDYYLVCADIQNADHNNLILNSDVLSIPVNIDQNLTSGAVTTARDFLETINIPGNWITTTDTYRGVLRSLCGIFQIMQRVTAITNIKIDWLTVTLNTQWQDLGPVWRDAITQAVNEKGFDSSGVTNTTTLRQILKYLGDQFYGSINMGPGTL